MDYRITYIVQAVPPATEERAMDLNRCLARRCPGMGATVGMRPVASGEAGYEVVLALPAHDAAEAVARAAVPFSFALTEAGCTTDTRIIGVEAGPSVD